VRAPRDIDLGQILEVIEGPFQLVDCVTAHEPAAPKPSLLPLSPSQQPRPAAPAPVADHACGLIGFCPTKTPMRIVHTRITDMFRSIRLDELSGLDAHAPAAAHAGSHR